MCLIVDEMKTLESKGLASIVESMDTVLEYNIWANGGQMNADELADLCDRLDNDWPTLGRFMSGYLFGATTDNPDEVAGEHLAIRRGQPMDGTAI